jgi:cyclase
MQRERVTDTIYVFTSDLYVQVTAGLIVTSAGAVLIDTLLYPEETLQIRRFAEDRLHTPVQFVVNTHHHADHTLGTCLFPGATVISHDLCRTLLETRGRDSLARMQATSPDLNALRVVLPTMTFTDRLSFTLGHHTLQLWAAPGHSADSIVCLVEQEQILFAADAVMPLPYFVDGSTQDLRATLTQLQAVSVEAIVQGHGEVILRGEAESKLTSDLVYLDRVERAVQQALAAPGHQVERKLAHISLESCGKDPTLLNGAADRLHRQNIQALIAMHRGSQVQLQQKDMTHG